MRYHYLLTLQLLLILGCGDDDPPSPPEATYEAVEEIVRQSCATSAAACHGGPGEGAGRLNFGRRLMAGEPITLALNAVSACQYDRWSLVEPGNPDESWLMIKLLAAHDAEGVITGFTPDAAWDPGLMPDESGRLPVSDCPLTVDGAISFGTNMPQIRGNPMPLSPEKIDIIRRWIEAGAPGPAGVDAG